MAFNGDAMRTLAAQFLAFAENEKASSPLTVGHRLMGMSLLQTGEIAQSRGHYDRALTLYDPAEHRPLATRFGQDVRVSILCYRSLAMWLLGYSETALANSSQALKDAREIGQAPTLIYALVHASWTDVLCGNYLAANPKLVRMHCFGERERHFALKGRRNNPARYRFVPNRQSSGRGANAHLWVNSIPGNGSNGIRAVVPVVFDDGLC